MTGIFGTSQEDKYMERIMKIQLKISTLKAAAICAAKKDIRYCLNGVCVDVKNESQVVIVGTDGHCMFIGVESYIGEWDSKAEQVIIPLETIVAALKGWHKTLSYIMLERLSAEKMSLGDVMFTPICGQYPDYARTIPKVETVQAGIGYYNHDYLAKGSKAMKEASGCGYPTLNQHGETDAAVMTCALPNYVCLIMPMSMRNNDKSLDAYKGIEIPQ